MKKVNKVFKSNPYRDKVKSPFKVIKKSYYTGNWDDLRNTTIFAPYKRYTGKYLNTVRPVLREVLIN